MVEALSARGILGMTASYVKGAGMQGGAALCSCSARRVPKRLCVPVTQEQS